MNNKQLKKFSIISGIITLFLLAFSYFFFHFVTDDGITFTFHEEAGKPFVANMLGQLSVLFLFATIISLIIYLIKRKDEQNK